MIANVPARTIVVLVMLVSLLAGCASKRVYRQPPPAEEAPAAGTTAGPAARRPADRGPATRPPAEVVRLGLEVASLAREQVGRPYRWGGDTPGEGFDCSGLVFWSYGAVGIGLPRVVREQSEAGRSITGDLLQPGDLVFFAIDGGRSSHVGIYLGDDEFVHAPGSGRAVRVDSLDDAWWRGRWTDSRRMIGG